MRAIAAIFLFILSLPSLAQNEVHEQVTEKYNQQSCKEIAKLLRMGGRKLELSSFTRGDDRSELMFHSIKQLIRRAGECLTNMQDEIDTRDKYEN